MHNRMVEAAWTRKLCLDLTWKHSVITTNLTHFPYFETGNVTQSWLYCAEFLINVRLWWESVGKQNSVADRSHPTLLTHPYFASEALISTSTCILPSWHQYVDHHGAPAYLPSTHEHHLRPSFQRHTGPSGQQHHGLLQLHWDQCDYSSE